MFSFDAYSAFSGIRTDKNSETDYSSAALTQDIATSSNDEYKNANVTKASSLERSIADKTSRSSSVIDLPIIEITPDAKERHVRFIIKCVTFCVGFSNVVQFPQKVYRFGSSYTIAYFIMIFIVGLPTLYAEICLGQFTRGGPVKFWKFSYLFQGTGYAIALPNLFTTIYYSQLCGYVLIYLISSFATEPRWSREDQYHHFEHSSAKLKESNFLSCLKGFDFYNSIISPHDGAFNMTPYLCVIISWLFVYICFFKFKRTKRTFSTAVLAAFVVAYVTMIILLFHSTTLDGSLVGLKIYIRPKYEELLNLDVWVSAAKDVFFSLNVQGCFAVLASNNNFNFDFFGDVIIVVLIEIFSSAILGFLVFSYLGVLSKQDKECAGGLFDSTLRSEIRDIEVAFVIFPSALSHLPIPAIWGTLFFGVLYIFAITSQIVMVLSVVTAVKDAYPWTRFFQKELMLFMGFILCGLSFPFNVKYGLDLFITFSNYSLGLNTIIIQLVTFIVLSWSYGAKNFVYDIEFMRGTGNIFKCIRWRYMRGFLIIMWKFISPIALIAILIFDLQDISTDGLPPGLLFVRIVLQWSPLAVFLYASFKKAIISKLSLTHWIRGKPAAGWGPADHKLLKEWVMADLSKKVSQNVQKY